MDDSLFMVLTPAEEAEFRQWARTHHVLGDAVSETWHPVVRDECRKIDEEARALTGK